jgi:glutamate-1-semialdehyde aminotransferase
MVRAEGCRVWDADGREYLDTIMALGAVSLGYAHPAVVAAVEQAARHGGVGPLPPVSEGRLADRLTAIVPNCEGVRFFKTGAEAVSAAVRIARVYTGRECIIRCGYHGWLDGVHDTAGVPTVLKSIGRDVPFNDVATLERAVASVDGLAALVVEPVVDAPPTTDWVAAVNRVGRETGAVLILDEIKTGLRLGLGGAAARYGFTGQLTALGKALGNGLPIAAVCGPQDLMEAFTETWVSSTLATEFISLAAAEAVLDVYEREDVPSHLTSVGRRLYEGLGKIADCFPELLSGVRGVPEFCYLSCSDEDISTTLAARCAERGLLFKRNAYNFVCLAHAESIVDDILGRVEEAMSEVARSC